MSVAQQVRAAQGELRASRKRLPAEDSQAGVSHSVHEPVAPPNCAFQIQILALFWNELIFPLTWLRWTVSEDLPTRLPHLPPSGYHLLTARALNKYSRWSRLGDFLPRRRRRSEALSNLDAWQDPSLEARSSRSRLLPLRLSFASPELPEFPRGCQSFVFWAKWGKIETHTEAKYFTVQSGLLQLLLELLSRLLSACGTFYVPFKIEPVSPTEKHRPSWKGST